ncbi:MAG: glycosyltransferase family 9 protein [Sneathiella sp.]
MKRTLFITSNRLGDAVLTTGVLNYLIDLEPDVPVTVVCGHLPAEIFRSVKGVEKVVPISKRKYSLHWLDAFKQLEFGYWHRIVDFRGSPLGFLPARHHHLWKGGADHIHKTEANAKTIGVEYPLPPVIRTEHRVSEKLGGLPENEKILAIAPTANSYKKQWHYENFIALSTALIKSGGILENAKIIVLGAPGEEEQAMPVVEGLPQDRVINFVGKTTPLEAAQILSYCDLFVGNDSGLMHTAVAVNIPTVGLFGIGKPVVYRPWGEKSLCLIGEPAGERITRTIVSDDHGNEVIRETLPLNHVVSEVELFYRRIDKHANV